jgi:hypothetical protein
MISQRQFFTQGRVQRWQAALICLLICVLALFFVTRFVDFSASALTAGHLSPSSGARSVAHVDHIEWVPPQVEALVMVATLLVRHDPLPSQPLHDDLYNRPPPSSHS